MNETVIRRTREAVVFAAVAVAAAASALAAKNPRDLKYPPLREVKIPEAMRSELENGLVVWLLEDHEFPMIEVNTLTRGGTVFDPKGQVGLADITAEVMRTGGSAELPGDQLDELIESKGMLVSVSAEDTRFTANVSMLKEDLAEGLHIFGEILRRPAFPEGKLVEARKKEETAIASRNDEPLDIAIRELRTRIYGADSPYGWHTEYSTIDAITALDLARMHDRFFHSNYSVLVAWGDFDAAEMKAAIEKEFGDWARTPAPVPETPSVVEPKATKLWYAEKKDVTSSVLLVGGIGIRRDDPIYPQAMVMEAALGGGFSSRLFNEIRTRRGLAYATGAFVNSPYDRKGTCGAYAVTQADSTVTTLRLLTGGVKEMIDGLITADELRVARDAILNSFVFDFASPGQIVLRQATEEFYGYPSDFLEKYQEAVASVTTADVQQATTAIFRPDTWQIVVVGNQEDFAEPLSNFAPVEAIDISIPERVIAFEIPEPTPQSLEAGKKLMAAIIDEYGGARKIEAVKDVKMTISGSVNMQGMSLKLDLKQFFKAPDRIYSEQSVMGQTMKQVVVGETGWMQTPTGVQDMDGKAIEDVWNGVISDGDLPFLTRAKSFEIQSVGTEEVDGKSLEVLYVRDLPDLKLRLYVDPETHHIVRSKYKGKHPMTGASVEMLSVASDFRESGGIDFAHKRDTYLDGELFFSAQLVNVAVDGGIDASVFEKP